ncbi:MAG TPA: hypothetical protein VG940_11570, partial [Gemmatimonadales bacterium]|nr:hypothetical protein [Gemmatimonadales bacterium]
SASQEPTAESGGVTLGGTSRLLALGSVLDHFRQMLATERYPEVMPMTSAVAPVFTTAHPRAAAIFDNLHALHDVISDILLNDAVVPRDQKRASGPGSATWRPTSTGG